MTTLRSTVATLATSALLAGSLFCFTQIATVEAVAQPDLIVQEMRIELITGNTCYTSTELGVRIVIKNQGAGTANAPFVVDVNGAQQTVAAALAAGATTSLWFPGYQFGMNTGTVDVTNVVVESDESNNSSSPFVAIPTLPLPCTPQSVGGTAFDTSDDSSTEWWIAVLAIVSSAVALAAFVARYRAANR